MCYLLPKRKKTFSEVRHPQDSCLCPVVPEPSRSIRFIAELGDEVFSQIYGIEAYQVQLLCDKLICSKTQETHVIMWSPPAHYYVTSLFSWFELAGL